MENQKITIKGDVLEKEVINLTKRALDTPEVIFEFSPKIEGLYHFIFYNETYDRVIKLGREKRIYFSKYLILELPF